MEVLVLSAHFEMPLKCIYKRKLIVILGGFWWDPAGPASWFGLWLTGCVVLCPLSTVQSRGQSVDVAA